MCVLLGMRVTEQRWGDRRNFTSIRHTLLVVTVKRWLKSVYIYGSYCKIKTGVPLFLDHSVNRNHAWCFVIYILLALYNFGNKLWFNTLSTLFINIYYILIITATVLLQILQAKIQRLEHLVQLKDIRIEDLQTRLKQMQEVAAAEADISPSSRPRIIRR